MASSSPDYDKFVVGSDGGPLIRCADAPPIPRDVLVGWGGDESGAVMSLFWSEGQADDEEFFEFSVRVDDPTCDERPELRSLLKVDTTPPRFEDTRIVLRPGQSRAYVGYTMIDPVGDLFALPQGITATREDGRPVAWKHQTATGGPSDIRTKGRMVVEPADDVAPYDQVGDADYFDSAGLKVGETVTVTFRFIAMQDGFAGSRPESPRAVVKVPFRVVSAR